MEISGLSRGFSTCCLRFTRGVATTHARLASGWLARLYREGVEPSGSLQKVSDHILIPLFWIYPGAMKAFSRQKRNSRPNNRAITQNLWTGCARGLCCGYVTAAIGPAKTNMEVLLSTNS